MRYFIQFAYHGKRYHGSQIQPNAITVQEVLQTALSLILKESIQIMAAGRTDAGVHARVMYAHFDFSSVLESGPLLYRLNAFLPADVVVQQIFPVPDDAHARFDAEERTYEYWVTGKKDPFLFDAAYYVKYPLNIAEMNKAATILVGHRDFQCFSKSKTDVRTYICDLRSAIWTTDEEKMVFTIRADRFLRNMVRAVVGTLINVGTGKTPLKDIPAIIESKDRSKAGISVPAKGLYLTAIKYPDNIINNHG
ncbi:tRNA pseudouridine synthase A [Arenibacter antarcticus]|uniref:tRNA pseudouridine synthase A n=1 Tax=Arenibacter antarcticus TaxID=2040469 RepID=A0ABW5VEH8_9FLAO|nr:tRNA pseudouridine(38-40) synthase TruA [Arenibacter sp. H213]MCM4169559.1 tRNA pseudouridine(38-40) synthase TruA [Arenibacter sp. H213]